MAITWKKVAYEADVITKAFMAAKGDLISASGNDTPLILGVGANDTVLTADSAEATGLKWAAGGGGGGLDNVVEDTTPQLGGDLEYNEKNQVFPTTLTSDNTASGDIITVTFGESVVFGDLVYPDPTDNEWKKALGDDANYPTIQQWPAMGMALETKGNGDSGKILLRGVVRDATHFSGYAMGDLLYLSAATAGAWTNTLPQALGNVVQIVGWVLAANYAFFQPSYTSILLWDYTA